MRTIVPWLLVFALLPRVEDPWPDAIGLGFVVTTAGAGAMLAGCAFVAAPPQRRERAIALGMVFGFLVGCVVYVISLAAQVGSHL